MTNEKKKDWLMLLIGLAGSMQVRYIGTFYLSEIIALLSFLFIGTAGIRKNSDMTTMVKMAMLWLAGAVFADLYNNSSTETTIKGAFNIVLLIAQIPFAYWILRDKTSRWVYYIFGYGISSVINFYLNRIGTFESEFERSVWTIYAWSPFVIGASALLYYKNLKHIALLLLGSWSLYTLFNNSRNVFLAQSLAISLAWMMQRVKYSQLANGVKKYKRRTVVYFLSLIVTLFTVDYIYESLAEQGALGERAYAKYIMQKSATGGLASGRADFLISGEFIAKNPIIGYGSYAIDKEHLANKLRASYGLEEDRREMLGETYEYNAIPCHSHILGTWVWHGIFAFLWWIYFIRLIWRMFSSGAILQDKRLLLLCASITMGMLWDIFFSPMGARLTYVYFGTFMILHYQTFKKRLNEEKR